MEPTLYSNNVLITEKISIRRGRVSRGDIIVARNPANPRQFICKRIIGMPGDTVVMHSTYSVNPFASATKNSTTVPIEEATTLLPTPPSGLTTNVAVTRKDKPNLDVDGEENADLDPDVAFGSMTQRMFRSNMIVVPRGHCWLEGDNAGNSLDSRQYGPVPLGLLRSRAIGRVWPPSSWCSF